MKTSFRTKVFAQAYQLMQATHKTFAVCLAKAWALYRLTKRMSSGVVSFCYEKSDGTLRKAKGTLKEVQHLIKGTGATTYATVRYFDVEAGGLLDNFDLCERMHVSKRTLQRYRSSGLLPFQMVLHKTYYKESDVQTFMRKHFAKFKKKKALSLRL